MNREPLSPVTKTLRCAWGRPSIEVDHSATAARDMALLCENIRDINCFQMRADADDVAEAWVSIERVRDCAIALIDAIAGNIADQLPSGFEVRSVSDALHDAVADIGLPQSEDDPAFSRGDCWKGNQRFNTERGA
jgi:hypothetical protein